MATHKAKPLMSNQAYDITKYIAQYVLPAAGALYFALAEIWGLPYATQIIGTLTAVDIFLGVLLGYSKRSYENSDVKYDGEFLVDESGEADDFKLSFNSSLEELAKSKELKIKVDRPSQ